MSANRYRWSLFLVLLLLPSGLPSAAQSSISSPAASAQPQLVTQLGHAGNINAVAFSPDGRLVASADTNGIAILWEAATGREIRRLAGHTNAISALAWSPDGKLLATAASNDYRFGERPTKDFTARVWDVATGREVRRLQHRGGINSIAFAPPGQYLLTGSDDQTAVLWSVASGAKIRTFSNSAHPVTSVAFSPDGRSLLTGSAFANDSEEFKRPGIGARLWDTATGREIRRFAAVTGEVGALTFDPQGRFIVVAGREPLTRAGLEEPFGLRALDLTTGQLLWQAPGYGELAFAPDGATLLTCGFDSEGRSDLAVLRDARTGQARKQLQDDEVAEDSGAVKAVAFAPDGGSFLVAFGTLSSGGSAGIDDGRISLRQYDLERREKLRLGGAVTGVEALSLSADGGLLLAGDSLWDLATGTERRFPGLLPTALHIPRNTSILSPDGSLAFTIGEGESDFLLGQVWETATGREVARVQEVNAYRAWFSPDSRYLLLGAESFVRQIEARTGRELWSFTDESLYANATRGGFGPTLGTADYAGDGALILARHNDSTLALLQPATGEVLKQFPITAGGSPWAAFAPGRTLFAAVDEGQNVVRVIEARTGRERRIPCSSQVFGLALAPDGRYLALQTLAAGPSLASEIQVWEMESGRQVWRATAQTLRVSPVFAPDSRTLLMPESETFLSLRDTASGRRQQTLRGHSGRVTAASFLPDSNFLVTGSTDGTTRVWSGTEGRELCRLVSFSDATWIVATPEGRFDTNNLEEIKGVHWVAPDDPLRPLPVEIFARDYYEPRLLARLLNGERFAPARSLADLNRVQPQIAISDIQPQTGTPDQVTVTVEAVNVAATVPRAGTGVTVRSGVHDLRLFRNGQLVGQTPGPALLSVPAGGAITVTAGQEGRNLGLPAGALNSDEELTAWRTGAQVKVSEDKAATVRTQRDRFIVQFKNVRLPRNGAAQVEFTAYAFNRDRVKSGTARRAYQPAPALAPRRGRAYVVAVGVNANEHPGLSLRYAANDARVLAQELDSRLRQSGLYEEVVTLALTSDYAADGKTLASNLATRAYLKGVLDLLAGRVVAPETRRSLPSAERMLPARSEDVVLLAFSGHGYADERGNFYLVPYDTGNMPLAGARPGQVAAEFLARCVSSDELSAWLREVDAGELTLIVDACQSAAVVEGGGFKPGPMGSRGLGQLSYDKGMRTLTATQADNVALENKTLQQGLLTYALVRDGLTAGAADFLPADQQIMWGEWLQYGVKRVPQIYAEVQAGRLKMVGDARSIGLAQAQARGQQPALFDFARQRRDFVLIRKD